MDTTAEDELAPLPDAANTTEHEELEIEELEPHSTMALQHDN